MYYSAPDIANAASLLQSKLSPDSLSFLTDMTNIPSFDQFSGQLSNLLPENILSLGSNGALELPNTTNLLNQLNSVASNVIPQLQQNAASMFNSLAGKLPINTAGVTSIQDLDSAAKQIASISQEFSKQTSNQMLDVFKSNTQGVQLGSLNNSINTTIDSAGILSPRGVRDLSDPINLQSKVGDTVTNTTGSLKSTSYNLAAEQAQNIPFTNSAQGNLQQLSSPKFSGSNSQGFDLYVRRTVYWAYGPGTDSDSAALKSSTGRQLQQGVSVAVDPSIIPYLSRVDFPDIGTRYATDTGGAVKARTASSGTVPIIDLFFLNKEEALKFANSSPAFVTVKVYPPASKYKYVANASPTYGIA